jgi:hypothetical protein
MENKTSKYFKYAIGEIILVVIGILIALQINNWNVNRIDAKEENTMLLALKKEISENQLLLENEVERHTKAFNLLIELTSYISPQPKEINDVKLDSLIFAAGWLPRYSPNEGVINSLISSGKISLIKNDDLSSKISSWNGLLDEYNTTYKWTERDVFELLAYIKDKYPFRRTLKNFDIETVRNSTFEFSKEDLLSDLGFESLLANRIIDAQDVLVSSEKMYRFQNEILELIEKELEN